MAQEKQKQSLLDKITADARDMAQKEIDGAKQKAAQVMEQAKRQAGQMEREILQKAAQDADLLEQKALSGAQAQKRQAVLAKKQELVSRALDKARQGLLSLDDESYANLIQTMARKSGITGAEVIVSQKDKARLAGRLAVSEQTQETGGGFLLKKGEIYYNFTFDALFEAQKDELVNLAAKILFGGVA